MDERFDVVVVGGGSSGLSAALALGRSRRSVLVIDEGRPRNAAAGHLHNYLGREGTAPSELLAIGRAEVEAYGVRVESGVVTSAAPELNVFIVQLADGRRLRARRIVLATGLVDELPDIPGLAEGWGDTVIHCAYCHGYEVCDQGVGVLATSSFAVDIALLFRQLTADLTLFLHTGPEPTPGQRTLLAARGVTVVEGEVRAWEHNGVRLASGAFVPRQALVVTPTFTARGAIAESLGLSAEPVEMNGQVIGTRIPADPTGRTAVPGVFVAGNVTDLRAILISAAAGGVMTGAMVNADLISEDSDHAVMRASLLGQDAWERRYRAHAERIWSGHPNAVLVAEVSELPPGRALDVGCGEGGDAVWLAERGWRVTGTDISTVALARAEAEARKRELEIDWRHVDLTADPPEPAAYELVSAHFFHLPQAERDPLFAALAEAVRPGGTLLLVGHHPHDLHTTIKRPNLPDMFFTPEQLVAGLDPDAWEVEVAEARPRTVIDPDGNPATISDTVLRARRR